MIVIRMKTYSIASCCHRWVIIREVSPPMNLVGNNSVLLSQGVTGGGPPEGRSGHRKA